MSRIVDVLHSAKKFANSTKDKAVSIIVNSLCSVIETLQKDYDELEAEKKELNRLALYYKKALADMRDKYQERSLKISERREILAKALSIDVNCEAWRDISDEKKNARILEAVKALKDQKILLEAKGALQHDLNKKYIRKLMKVKPIYFQCDRCKGTKEVPERDYIETCGYNNCPGVVRKKDMFQKKGFWHRHYGFICPVCGMKFYSEKLIKWPMIPCPDCQG